MSTKSLTSAASTALLTLITLGGSVWGFVFLAGPNSVTRLNVIRSDNIMINLLAILAVFLCGGGFWGLGIARLMSADARSLVIASALSWSGTLFSFLITVVLLGNYFGGFSKINVLPRFPHSLHYNFLLIFVTFVGIMTAINSYVATSKLGLREKRRSVGMKAGLAAALGFLAVGLILFYGFGWEVGYPIIRKYGMLKILLICSMGATLAGGAALGWMLSRARSIQERM